MTARPFLTAEWRFLAMLNFEIAPATLAPCVPRGTELDSFDGRTLVSLVAFRFLRTRVLGAPIPFHRNFTEVNLRFYVRRMGAEGWRRGVFSFGNSCLDPPSPGLPGYAMVSRIAPVRCVTESR